MHTLRTDVVVVVRPHFRRHYLCIPTVPTNTAHTHTLWHKNLLLVTAGGHSVLLHVHRGECMVCWWWTMIGGGRFHNGTTGFF